MFRPHLKTRSQSQEVTDDGVRDGVAIGPSPRSENGKAVLVAVVSDPQTCNLAS